MNRVAVPIREHLKLDVSGILNIFFEEHTTIAKGFLGFTLRGLDGIQQIIILANDAHSFATAASRCLD